MGLGRGGVVENQSSSNPQPPPQRAEPGQVSHADGREAADAGRGAEKVESWRAKFPVLPHFGQASGLSPARRARWSKRVSQESQRYSWMGMVV